MRLLQKVVTLNKLKDHVKSYYLKALTSKLSTFTVHWYP